MIDLLLDKNHELFKLIENHIKDAIKTEIEVSGQWEINKDYLEEFWSAEKLNEFVENKFNIKLSNSEIETYFQEDDDIESLSNCFVEFNCSGEFGHALEICGLKPKLVIDVFNDIYGTDIGLVTDNDVDNNVSLFKVFIENKEKIDKNLKYLVEFFDKFKG